MRVMSSGSWTKRSARGSPYRRTSSSDTRRGRHGRRGASAVLDVAGVLEEGLDVRVAHVLVHVVGVVEGRLESGRHPDQLQEPGRRVDVLPDPTLDPDLDPVACGRLDAPVELLRPTSPRDRAG